GRCCRIRRRDRQARAVGGIRGHSHGSGPDGDRWIPGARTAHGHPTCRVDVAGATDGGRAGPRSAETSTTDAAPDDDVTGAGPETATVGVATTPRGKVSGVNGDAGGFVVAEHASADLESRSSSAR